MTAESTMVDETANDDIDLLPGIRDALAAAGEILVTRYRPTPAFVTRADVVEAIHANDDASLAVLRPALIAVRPNPDGSRMSLRAAPCPTGSGG